MLVPISDSVLSEILKLQAIEEGRRGNYIFVDSSIDKIRYRVSDLVMASVLREVRRLQSNPRI
jgi:hypothetical protein